MQSTQGETKAERGRDIPRKEEERKKIGREGNERSPVYMIQLGVEWSKHM